MRRTSARLDFLYHLGALFFFCALTVGMTWPLALHFNQLSGGLGDNVHFVFLIRWYSRALAVPGTSLFEIPWLNYPAGWSLASTDTSFAATLPGIPFTLLIGDAAGFNAAMLLTFVLSGWAMFAWIYRLTRSVPAGLLAGTLFSFMPYHEAHYLIGHLNLSSIQWFPLYFWGLSDLLRARRWEWKPAILAGLALGLIALISMYYLYMALVLGGIFALGYLLLVEWRAILRLEVWLSGATAGLVALPLCFLGIYPFVAFARQGGIASRSIEYAAQYSASPSDFVLPFPGGLLWSGLMKGTYLSQRWIEQSLYIGIIGLVLALTAWVVVKAKEQRALLKLAALCGLAAFILALGVELSWFGQTVTLNGRAVALPGLFLFEHAPFFDKMRALARFGFFVPMFVSFSAGLGAAGLFARLRPRWAWPLAGVLILLALLDFGLHPPSTFTTIGPRAVDTWLAAQPGQGAVAQFPFKREVDQDLVYYSLYHGKPYIGGFFSANYPDQYWQIQPALDTFPSREAIDQLRALKVEYVLLEEGRYSNWNEVKSACLDLGMPLRTEVDGYSVFGLPGD